MCVNMISAKGLVFALALVSFQVEGLPKKADGSERKNIPGGLSPRDVKDEKIQSLANFSFSAVKTSLGSNDELILVKVTEAYSQVVAGSLYHITMEVSTSKGVSKSCTVKVLEQLWISPDPKVTEVICEDKPSS
nr:PREDICTED: cystatin-like [Bemisia tabaci]